MGRSGLREARSLEEEAEDLKNRICERCEGAGEIPKATYGNEIDPPYEKCIECGGSGLKK